MNELKLLTVASFLALLLVVAVCTMVLHDSSSVPHVRAGGVSQFPSVYINDKMEYVFTDDQSD